MSLLVLALASIGAVTCLLCVVASVGLLLLRWWFPREKRQTVHGRPVTIWLHSSGNDVAAVRRALEQQAEQSSRN